MKVKVALIRVSLKDGVKHFQKTGGSKMIVVSSNGDIEVPPDTSAQIYFRPKPGDFFSKDGQGNRISMKGSAPRTRIHVLNSERELIRLLDDNPAGPVDERIDYALYLNNQTIDPAIINKGSGR